MGTVEINGRQTMTNDMKQAFNEVQSSWSQAEQAARFEQFKSAEDRERANWSPMFREMMAANAMARG